MIALIALASAQAGAQTSESKTTTRVLDQHDTDGDGRLTREEAPLHLLPKFDRIDRDGDNAIDRHEAWEWDQRVWSNSSARRVPAPGQTTRDKKEAGEPTPAATFADWINKRDRNGDGKLDIDEIPSRYRPRFDRIDANGDGYVDLTDADLLEKRRDAAANRSAGTAPRQRRTIVRTIHLMDTNGDGVLQRREAPMAMQRGWKAYDENGDGAIDRAEAESADRRIDAEIAESNGS